ncbi:MAG: hypothetical protein Q4B79_01295 [Moraxella sp.]|uniref:hypothetical protein n=1 Tax=Moraxella sp. TaxID=479 RepID=UPI0026DBC241|nr:hypothetical protein [Moraxella sp.]MDO4449581.1 hypothetical protein [Moraxella sp.]
MKKTKILLGVVGFLFMIFVMGIVWQVATVGGVAPDPKFLEKAISKSALTHTDIPNDTMHSDIIQYQCQRMPNGQRVFDCQMTMFYDRKTGTDKIITHQLTVEPSGNLWGERWRLLDVKTPNIADKSHGTFAPNANANP